MRNIFRSVVDTVFSPSRLRFYVWASLVSQIMIVVTGAAVRLTGSGLGCPTWPKCTQDSLVTVPEMGIHGIIEFANRLLTFVLALIALVTFVTIKRLAKEHRGGLVWTSFSLGMGIVAQALVGGITVLTKLTWWVVGLHFVISGVLIAIATILVWNFYRRPRGVESAFAKIATLINYLLGLVTVLLGVVVTGSGPHAGDFNTPRSGFDLEIVQHYHSYPAYLLLASVIAVEFALRAERKSTAFKLNVLLIVGLSLQAVIGVLQARLGVPPLLVAIHMFGAATLVALLTATLLAATPSSKR